MRRLFLCAVVCLVLFSMIMSGQTKPATDPLVQEMAGQIGYVGDKWVKLLEATPDDKLDWRPEKGVRSIRELYTHIADANVFFMSFVGVKAPAGQALPKEQTERENRFATKADIVKHLKWSFEFCQTEFAKLTVDALNKEVNMFGTKTTGRNASLVSHGHMHEHLGQAIAYARVNGYTPPWSE